jgi:hypothetical protein
MRKLGYIFLFVFLTVMASCSTSRSSLSDLRNLSARVNSEGHTYGVKEWKRSINDYSKIDRKIAKFAVKGKYSDSEMEEIGRLQADCLAGFAKGVGRNITYKIGNINSFLRGLLEGMSSRTEEE